MLTTASCLCGDIRWECAADSESNMSHCHCSMCRKAHGSAYATFVSVPERDFRWLAGEARLARYRATPDSPFDRTFCPSCGSAGPTVVDSWAFVPAGCMDGDPGARPHYHIFAGPQHNAPWFPITDDLKQFEAFGPRGALAVPAARPPTTSTPGGGAGSCLSGASRFRSPSPSPRSTIATVAAARRAGRLPTRRTASSH